MSKIIILLFFILFNSIVLCKEPWQCDSQGRYKCPEDQTCCRSKIFASGWACFPSPKAVCCSDGKSYCPENTICNLRENKCDSKPLQF